MLIQILNKTGSVRVTLLRRVRLTTVAGEK